MNAANLKETARERDHRARATAIEILLDFGPRIKTLALVKAIERAGFSSEEARGALWGLAGSGDLVIGPWEDLVRFPEGSANERAAQERAAARARRRARHRAGRTKAQGTDQHGQE